MNPNKPGFATSEFWITVLVHLVALVNGLLPFVIPPTGHDVPGAWQPLVAMLASLIAQVKYNHGRVSLKQTAAGVTLTDPDTGTVAKLGTTRFPKAPLILLVLLPLLCLGGCATGLDTATRATIVREDAIARTFVNRIGDGTTTRDQEQQMLRYQADAWHSLNRITGGADTQPAAPAGQ